MTDLALGKRIKSSFSFMLLLSLFFFMRTGELKISPWFLPVTWKTTTCPWKGPKKSP